MWPPGLCRQQKKLTLACLPDAAAPQMPPPPPAAAAAVAAADVSPHHHYAAAAAAADVRPHHRQARAVCLGHCLSRQARAVCQGHCLSRSLRSTPRSALAQSRRHRGCRRSHGPRGGQGHWGRKDPHEVRVRQGGVRAGRLFACGENVISVKVEHACRQEAVKLYIS